MKNNRLLIGFIATVEPTVEPTQAPTEAPTPTPTPNVSFENPSEEIKDLDFSQAYVVRDKDGNVVKVYTTAADYIRYVTGVVKGPIKYEEGILNEDNTFTIYKGTEYEATYNSYETWQAFKATFGTDEVMTFEDRGGVLYPVQKQKTR